jgi:serine/threonine protein kinase/Flp pilus assembly protein TadD
MTIDYPAASSPTTQAARALPKTGAETTDPSPMTGVTAILGLDSVSPTEDVLPGQTIGGVTIRRLLAEGGMGRVYEGVQDKPRRLVAVKLIRSELAAPSHLRRFEYEAEVLGRLQHAGIAHIYATGTAVVNGRSRPYFLMEYVADARPITSYADERHLSLPQRLDLFRSVCEAVAYGHHKGVIHRDLKPSNILVDASGRAKVIDFGVARGTASDAALTTMHTQAGQLVGTLQYMCPEQFHADPDGVDVRADIYALGVVLWELTTRMLPYDLRGKPLGEAMRIIQEDIPSVPLPLSHSGHRDLRLIALKCLEKDRERRYSSASELAEDIACFVRGDAISVSPPTLTESLSRLSRRHKVAAAAFAAVFATMAVAVVGISSYYLQAEREREWAEKQRVKAQRNEAAAIDRQQDTEKVLSFLIETFQLPATRPGRSDVTVRDLLAMARQRLEEDRGDNALQGDLLVEGNILKAFGISYLGLGLPFEARSCLTDGLASLTEAVAGDSSDKAWCMNELGLALQSCGECQQAEAQLRTALAMMERVFGPSHLETSICRNNLAATLTWLAQYDEAAALLDNALASCERHLGPVNVSVATVLSNLGELHYRKGDYTTAESFHTRAMLIREAVVGPDHPANVRSWNALGDVYRVTGRLEQAASALAKAHHLEDRFHAADDPQAAGTLSRIGELYRVQGELLQARSLLEQALAICEQRGLGEHPDAAVILHRLALVDAAEGRDAEAVQLLKRVIAIRGRQLGGDHPDVVAAIRDLKQICGTPDSPGRDTHAACDT